MFKLTSFALALGLLQPQLLSAAKSKAEKENRLPYVTSEPTQVITPTVAPEVTDRVNVTTSADFLWWKSYFGGFSYAMSGNALNNTNASPNRGDVKKPPFAFAPGIKLLLGIDYKLDGFDSTAIYTGLYSGKERVSANLDSSKGLASNLPLFQELDFFVPALLNLNGEPTVQGIVGASCTWKQQFNVLDLELGRNFFISTNLTLRPAVGMKLSWIEENFDVQYEIIGPGEIFPCKLHQRQFGIGVRGGLNSLWQFTKEIGIYGNFAATALWSDFHNHFDVSENLFGEVITIENIEGRIYKVIPVLEIAMGVQGMVWFNKDSCLFFARAGWEGQVWWNFNQFALPADRMHGTLSLQGLALRFGFTY